MRQRTGEIRTSGNNKKQRPRRGSQNDAVQKILNDEKRRESVHSDGKSIDMTDYNSVGYVIIYQQAVRVVGVSPKTLKLLSTSHMLGSLIMLYR